MSKTEKMRAASGEDKIEKMHTASKEDKIEARGMMSDDK